METLETIIYGSIALGCVAFTVWYVGNVGSKD